MSTEFGKRAMYFVSADDPEEEDVPLAPEDALRAEEARHAYSPPLRFQTPPYVSLLPVPRQRKEGDGLSRQRTTSVWSARSRVCADGQGHACIF